MSKRKIKRWTWFMVIFFYVLTCALLAWYMVLYRNLSDTVKYLKDNQSIMVWTMDKSCYNQIISSMDGTLRLQIKK